MGKEYLEKEVTWKDPKPIKLGKKKSTFKKVIDIAKKFRPDKNSFDTGKGVISYKIKPKFKEIGKMLKGKDSDILGETSFKLRFDGTIDDETKFWVEANGKFYKMGRDGFESDDSFSTKIGFTKTF